jgi:hypothetical protein
LVSIYSVLGFFLHIVCIIGKCLLTFFSWTQKFHMIHFKCD